MQKLSHHFSDEAPLLKAKLIERSGADGEPLLSQTLKVDEAVVAWLLGRYQPHADLDSFTTLLSRQQAPSQTDRLLAADLEPQMALLIEITPPPLVVFWGADQISQKAAMRCLGHQLARSLLMVDMAALLKSELTALTALRLAFRDARLTAAVPCLLGWDACLNVDGELPPALLSELCAYSDLAIIMGQTQWQATGLARDRTILWLEFPIPTYPQRLALWQHFLEAELSHNRI